MSDLAGGTIRKCEGADSRRIDAVDVDRITNPLDQAQRLSRPRAGENKHRPLRSGDGLELSGGRNDRFGFARCHALDESGPKKVSYRASELRHSERVEKRLPAPSRYA